MASSFECYMGELSDTGTPLVASKLVTLSDLSPEELDIFIKGWPDIEVGRRRQIVGRLSDLLEDNLELDFNEVLRACVNDDDGEVRTRAAEGMWGSEERSLIEPLVRLLLDDEEHTVRAAAAGALGNFAMLAEMGKLPQADAHRIEDALLAAFDDENEYLAVRCRVLEAISPLENPQVEEMIRQAYHSDELEFQVSALYAMGRNCNDGWLPLLLKELRSPNPQLRFEAARACEELEAEEAVPHLLELTHDSDAEVKTSAVEALGRIGGETARESLQEFLESSDESIREAAQAALDEIAFWEDPSGIDL
ncbi:MAG: HEAT repeat domain-containing protein [Dehalococcoidia bacterium]|nr:HEAT repeat domain-containing protein [Dehalococcoidia bacterium]